MFLKFGVLIFILGLNTKLVLCCSCDEIKLSEEIKSDNQIVVAEILSIENVYYYQDGNYRQEITEQEALSDTATFVYGYWKCRIKILKNLNPKERISEYIITPMGSTNCGIPFEKNQRYIINAKENFTSTCFGTRKFNRNEIRCIRRIIRSWPR